MNRKEILKKERGIFLPIFAAIALALLVIVGYFGIKAPITKVASAILRKKTEEICLNAAGKLPLQGEVEAEFERQLQSLDLPRYIELDKVTLYLPTMSGTFPLFSVCTDFTVPANSLDCHGAAPNCDLKSAVCDLPGFPPNLWHNNISAGNAVGCKLEAKINILGTELFGGETRIEALSVYWNPVVNVDEDQQGFNPTQGRNGATNHGLTVIVAPEMMIRGAVDGNSGNVNNGSRFSFGSDYGDYDPVGVSGIFFNLPNPAISYNYNNRPHQFPSLDPVYGNSRAYNSLLINCMNPAIAVRNSFLYAILALAARDAHLRMNTEVVLAQPQHLIRQEQNPTEAATCQNLPIVLVQKESDLANTPVVLPFISFYNGSDANSEPDWKTVPPFQSIPGSDSVPQKGWIYPFNLNGASALGLPPDVQTIEAHISSQLVNCFHLYNNSGGISYDLATTLREEGDFASVNGDFEPLPFSRQFSFCNLGRCYFRQTNNGPWYQNLNLWGAPSSVSAEAPNILDLVMALGAIQYCPVPGINQGPIDNNCSVPDSDDLSGDLIAALNYASGQLQAFQRHGLWAFVNGYSFDTRCLSLQSAFDAPRISALPDNSPVLIVTHRPLRRASDDPNDQIGEVDDFRNLVGVLNTQGRPVIVVYFPTSLNDASQQNITNWLLALGLPTDGSLSPNSLNKLYVFSPNLQAYQSCYGASTDDSAFRPYWNDLLTPGNSGSCSIPSIVDFAEDIFHAVILQGVRKKF